MLISGKGKLFIISAALMFATATSTLAEIKLTDTGYQEQGTGKAATMHRTFTIDTGRKQFVLQTNGASLGLVNSSWHAWELCVVDVNSEKFFAFNDQDALKTNFKERTTYKVSPGADAATLAATQDGQRAKVTLLLTARKDDDKLALTVKVDPKQKFWATTIGFECYPSATGPRHKLSLALATAQRSEILKPWESEKHVSLRDDESWVFFYDSNLDLGAQKTRGGCALFFAPEETVEAIVKLSAVHIDPRFRYGPGVAEMHFALLDFSDEKTNADALAYMKTLSEKGYHVGTGKPRPPAGTEGTERKPDVPPAPQVERRPYPLLPGGALPVVAKGESAYSIYCDSSAPSSVQAAAKELQRVIAISAGVTLPIRNEPTPPMICLGDNAPARAAGLAGQSLPYDHFRIRTVGENLYIVGRDTGDGEKTPFGGVSLGTRFGVSTFLERVVGARWIMPGAIGEEIPRKDTLTVPPMDVEEGPAFSYRTLSIPAPPVVNEWALRHKVGTCGSYGNSISSLIVNASHSWDDFLPKGLRMANPAWDAVDGEENKFCTRRPDAVAAFAENAVFWLQQHPDRQMVSAAPSDGQSFCRCAQCMRFTEKDAHGKESVTLNILDFYNDVARVVARDAPGRMVGGFAYGLCTYPPSQPVMLEPNVFIQWTPLNYYGLGLYKPAYRAEFERVAAAWRALTPNVSYWNYCHWHRSESGAPYAPALSIMKFQFPILKRLGYRGVTEEGTASWSYGGPNNYLLAKLLWNPEADVDALFKEWLELAYGEGADAMGRLYALLDDGYRDFKMNKESFHYHGDNYEIMPDKIQAIYVPRMGQIEALYRAALSAVKGERTRLRLELFGSNMVVFHYNLRKAGYLTNPEKSVFYRSDKEYEEFLQQPLPDALGDGVDWFRRDLQQCKPIEPKPTAAPQVDAERRALTIPKRSPAPIIDGRVAPEEWKGAAVAKEFRLPGSRTPAQQQTTVRLIYDTTALYVSFECEENRLAEMKTHSLPEDDMRIYNGNTAELFLNFTDNPNRCWHLTVNPANSRWDGMGGERSDNLTWKSAAAQGEGKWVVEMAIPFSSLGITNPAGKTCRANAARTRVIDGHREHSTWNAVNKSFLEPEN
ncbi:MAG: hypothetical protein COS85_17255, partial [Armatimonadetes bacterium CG07_land_8_20_14_0_80_59_28]